MGGFANKSYSRDMYDFDSDEEVVAARDRWAAGHAAGLFLVVLVSMVAEVTWSW